MQHGKIELVLLMVFILSLTSCTTLKKTKMVPDSKINDLMDMPRS